MTNVERVMLKHGKITTAEIDAKATKEKAIDDAIATYTAGKNTMTKAQISACLDTIVANKTAVKAKVGKS